MFSKTYLLVCGPRLPKYLLRLRLLLPDSEVILPSRCATCLPLLTTLPEAVIFSPGRAAEMNETAS